MIILKSSTLSKALRKLRTIKATIRSLLQWRAGAKGVQEKYEDRQTTTADALAQLLNEIRLDEERKKQQETLNLDNLTFFIFKQLESSGLSDSEQAGKDIRKILTNFPD